MFHRSTILKTAAALPAVAALGFGALAVAPAANAATPSTATVKVASTSARHLMTGDRGSDVRAWQQNIDRVAGKIPGVAHIATDGVFGARTTAATKDFQQFAHIYIDGIVGPHTRTAMNTALHGAR